MKIFTMPRKRGNRYRSASMVELSYWDILEIVFGREIEMTVPNEMVVVRTAFPFSLSAGKETKSQERENGK